MQGKLAVSLILFLAPSLTVPVLLIFFLTTVPGQVGIFFKDYGTFFLWGCYLLLLVGWVFFYRKFRAAARQEQVAASASEPPRDETPLLTEETAHDQRRL